MGAWVLLAAGATALATASACGARTSLPSPETCEPFDEEIDVAPAAIDMHLLLDSSGSMEDLTSTGTRKWDAVVGALQVFFESPRATDIGVGLSCFPVLDLAVPNECADDDACGVPGACAKVGICLDSDTSCEVSIGCTADGFPDEVCTPLGSCELAPEMYCAPSAGLECLDGQGTCVPLGVCDNRSSCEVADYSTPLVPLQTLPEAGDALLAVVYARVPEGATTTLPALVGVHQQARAGATARPERRQVVVVATDGIPTECDPTLDSGDDDLAIRNLAEAAEGAAAGGVRTFVVGVFAEEEQEEAQENLDTLARAGGTERAYLVGAEQELSVDFARALEEAEVSASSCEYELPGRTATPDGDAAETSAADVQLATYTLRSRRGDRRLDLLPSASACVDGGAGAYILEGAWRPRLVLCQSICAVAVAEGLPPIAIGGGCAPQPSR